MNENESQSSQSNREEECGMGGGRSDHPTPTPHPKREKVKCHILVAFAEDGQDAAQMAIDYSNTMQHEVSLNVILINRVP